jgi:hypothetical protein
MDDVVRVIGIAKLIVWINSCLPFRILLSKPLAVTNNPVAHDMTLPAACGFAGVEIFAS